MWDWMRRKHNGMKGGMRWLVQDAVEPVWLNAIITVLTGVHMVVQIVVHRDVLVGAEVDARDAQDVAVGVSIVVRDVGQSARVDAQPRVPGVEMLAIPAVPVVDPHVTMGVP